MKLVKFSLAFALLFAYSVSPSFAEEAPETLADIPPVSTEEVVPEEESVIEETQESSENIEMFSELSSIPEEISCWQDENKNTWCMYSDGTTGIKQSNPFFTQLATYNQTSNFLQVNVLLNGSSLGANEVQYVPIGEEVQLEISFNRSRAGETYAPYEGVLLDWDGVVKNAGTPVYNSGTMFVFYKGEIGKADWITEATTPYGEMIGRGRGITFTEPGHYFFVAIPMYYPEKDVPGLSFNQFNYLKFLQFLSTGIEQEGATGGPGIIDPLLYGIVEFDVVDITDSPKASSVLFLPGIKGSKLWMASNGCDFLFFDCEEEPLWPPSGHQDIRDLFLDFEGKSVNQVYAKKDQTLDSYFEYHFYTAFRQSLSELKSGGTITDFSFVPYDWRLSLDDLVTKGKEQDGKIFYSEATDTPYIEQELRRLAETSQTGKVTVVTHSNGGLVAKRLFVKLGAETASLVDNFIMIGAPQSGAPQAIGALLFGYREALPYDYCSQEIFFGYFCSLLSSRDVARELAENSPMAYQLLPSFSYFESVDNTQNPVARFSGTHAYAQDFAMYGETIDTWNELSRFLRADDQTRLKPLVNDIIRPNVLNSFLLNYAEDVHRYKLDYWTPPDGVAVYQLAGWGVDTISGIEFLEQSTPYLEYLPLYRPIFVEDGDGVVPVPSALMIPASDSVRRFWIDLNKFKKDTEKDKEHQDLFTIESVMDFIQNILNKSDSLPNFISNSQPPTINESKKLRFILYAEAALRVEDEQGSVTGLQEDGSFKIDISNSNYDIFGGTKIITVPEKGTTYKVTIQATTTSEKITLDIEKVVGGKTMKRSTITNVPLVAQETLSFTIEDETGSTTPIVLGATEEPLVSFEEDAVVVYGEVGTSTPTEESSGDTDTSSDSGTRNKTSHASSGREALSFEKEVAQTKKSFVENYEDAARFDSEKEKEVSAVEDVVGAKIDSIQNTRKQTASVYDAFVHIYSWLKEVLYTVLRFVASLFGITFTL